MADQLANLGQRLEFTCRAADAVGFFALKALNNDTEDRILYHLAYLIILANGVFDDLALTITLLYSLQVKSKYDVICWGRCDMVTLSEAFGHLSRNYLAPSTRNGGTLIKSLRCKRRGPKSNRRIAVWQFSPDFCAWLRWVASRCTDSAKAQGTFAVGCTRLHGSAAKWVQEWVHAPQILSILKQGRGQKRY